MTTSPPRAPAIWFPAVRCGSGADVFTERLCRALTDQGIQAEITWLPHRAEYAPWSVRAPTPPIWANVIHVNTWLHPRFIPVQLPLVATMHHVVHDPAFSPYRTLAQALYHRFWIKPNEATVLRRADAITAVSQYTAQQLRAIFGRDDVTVIPNCIDTDVFRPGPDRPPHYPFRLLFVGNWSRRKGADLLAPIMQNLGLDFELWVTSGLREWVGNTPLPPNIRFLGRLPTTDALVRAYQDTDALLFPSRLEGFGLAALEAQACGLPVVATSASSLPEVVEPDVTGFLCLPDDVAAFTTACRRLAQPSGPWRSMREAARRRAVSIFPENLALNRYVNLYRAKV